MKQSGEILIYQTGHGSPDIKVTFEKDTLWLDQSQISQLFGVDRTSIYRHIRNIYKSEELDEESTCVKNAQVQYEGERQINRKIKIYNLDLIISVGYRVNSKRGTQFRIWSNKIIKQHFVKGYTQNDRRLEELQTTIQIANRASKLVSTDLQTKGLFDILSDYALALDLLDKYDHQRLVKTYSNQQVIFSIDYASAKNAIESLRVKFGGSTLFGNEKDNSFRSSIATIDQTFDSEDLYPNIEDKAAHLLYFVVKNHSFSDGNKRIGAWLFLWYLDNNKFLYKPDGTMKIANNTLVALTLMIAESKPQEKEMMINVIVNLID